MALTVALGSAGVLEPGAARGDRITSFGDTQPLAKPIDQRRQGEKEKILLTAIQPASSQPTCIDACMPMSVVKSQ
jgi:hypothetical protein